MSSLLQRVFLAVFVVIDVILIVGAVRHVNGTPPSADMPQAASATTTASPEPADALPASDDSTTQLPFDFNASEAVALGSANDGTVVYGTRGRCSDPAAPVQVSTDGGADFAPTQTGLTTTLAVRAKSAKSITVVGTTADCKVQQLESTNGGSSWAAADKIDLWYPAPDDAETVVTPTGASKPGEGCIVTSVSQVTTESGRVSCADGTIRGSGNNGKQWVQLGRLDNVRVSAFLTPSAGFALARYSGCAANAFTTTDGGVTWTPGGCISGESAQAISATTNGLAAVVAGETFASTDNGQTWMQP
ncbi:WD40/YVTN/BNR-like repeat-containing protein [Aeromicrobium wangtongii]|uniref:WD40/YVTN/BNR-like repeat-containing protein n=1 Tax=Aeromicrobium wangtongii TaxID=2969247 RepID=UPI002018238C|nr:hypothetical protein [Aeromicrobium wangtongii]MCL3817230.1 hypothetical protein [Aeromicrobium wangtongii]